MKGKRKLIALAVLFLAVIAIKALGYEITETVAWLLGATTTSFMAGNTGEHFAEKLQKKLSTVIPGITDVPILGVANVEENHEQDE